MNVNSYMQEGGWDSFGGKEMNSFYRSCGALYVLLGIGFWTQWSDF